MVRLQCETKLGWVRVLLFTTVAALVAQTGSVAQEVGLTARTDSSKFRIGDWITLHIVGRVPSNVESITPAVKDSIGPFEILKAERAGTEPRWSFQLMTLDSGEVFIPPIAFVYKLQGDTTLRRAFTNSVALAIAGISVDPQGEIKDIKPPLSSPWKFEDYLPFLVALVVLGAAGVGFYYYWKRRKQKDLAVPERLAIPPHREALAALRDVEEKKLWQQGKVKQYYSEVTGIIRVFFERRWNIIALELTSDEILQQMKGIPEAQKVWKELQSSFVTADLVKFAKYEPTPAEHEDEMRFAYEIVRAMIPPAPSEEQVGKEEGVYAG